VKIILRQFDEVLAENSKLQQKEFCNHLIIQKLEIGNWKLVIS